MTLFTKRLKLVLLFMNGALLSQAQPPIMKVQHLSYSIIYDYAKMSPAVVWYQLRPSDFSGSSRMKPHHFKMDYLLPPPRLNNKAFTKSGYQRGHLCPSGDRDVRKDWFKDTYFTSNVLPMTPELNAGAWKEIEDFCRSLAKGGHVLRVAAGPIWQPCVLYQSSTGTLHVPSHVWKVCSCLVHQNELWCWVVPNTHRYTLMKECEVTPSELLIVIPPYITNLIKSWIEK